MKSSPIPTSRPADRLPRDRRIDLCYVIGILLVVAGHSGVDPRFASTALFRWIYAFHMPLFFAFGLSVPLRRRERTGRCGDFRTPPCAAAAVAACRVDDARLHPQGAVERLCHAAVGVEFFSLSARLSLSGPTYCGIPAFSCWEPSPATAARGCGRGWPAPRRSFSGVRRRS